MMDIAPAIVPGSAAPVVDSPASSSAVPTVPGQAFSDLFAVALNGAGTPAIDPTAVSPVAVVAVPVIPIAAVPAPTSVTPVAATPSIEPTPLSAVPTVDVPVAAVLAPGASTPTGPATTSSSSTNNPIPKASPSDSTPTVDPGLIAAIDATPDTPTTVPQSPTKAAVPVVATEPPESPPLASSVSRKDAQAEAPIAPAPRLDRPENKDDAKDVAAAADQLAAMAATSDAAAQTAAQAAAQTVASQNAAVQVVAGQTAAVQTPNAPPTAASTPETGKVVADKTNRTNRTDKSYRSERGTKAEKAAGGSQTAPLPDVAGSVTANSAPDFAADDSASDSSAMAIRVVTPPSSGTSSVGLDDAPDLGIIPVVTVAGVPSADPVPAGESPFSVVPSDPMTVAAATPEVAVAVAVNVAAQEPAKVAAKETSTTIQATGLSSAPVKATAVEAPDARGAAEKSSAAFGDQLMEAAASSGKDDATDSGEQAPQDTFIADPTPQVATRTSETSATERPEAGTSRREIDRHLVVRQVADRIENLVAGRPRDGVTVHLEPRDLGTITLVVKGMASALDVQMTASDARVREGLESSRTDLAQALAPRGIELRDVRIVTSSSNGAGANSREGGQSSNPNPNQEGRPRQQSSNSSQTGFSGASNRTTTQPRARGSRRTGGVDLLA